MLRKMGSGSSTAGYEDIALVDIGRTDDTSDDYNRWKINNYTELLANFGEDEAAWRKQYEKYPDMSIIWHEDSSEQPPSEGESMWSPHRTLQQLGEYTSGNRLIKGDFAQVPTKTQGNCPNDSTYTNAFAKFEADDNYHKRILVRGDYGVTAFIVDKFADFQTAYPWIWQVAFTFKEHPDGTYKGTPAICIYVDMNVNETAKRITQFVYETNPHVMRVINTALYEAVSFDSHYKIFNFISVVGNPAIANRFNVDIFLAEGTTNQDTTHRFKNIIELEKTTTKHNDQLVKAWDRLYELCALFDNYVQTHDGKIVDRIDALSKEIQSMYIDGVQIKNDHNQNIHGLRTIVLDKDNGFVNNLNHDGWILGRMEEIKQGDRNTKRKDNESDESYAGRLWDATIQEWINLKDGAFYQHIPELLELPPKKDASEVQKPPLMSYAWNALFIVHYEVDGFGTCLKEGFCMRKHRSTVSIIACVLIVLLIAFIFTSLFIGFCRRSPITKPINDGQTAEVIYRNDEQ